MYNEDLNGETKTLPEDFWRSPASEVICTDLGPLWWDVLELCA